MQQYIVTLLFASLFFSSWSYADVELPQIFSDHMVLQQEQHNPIWGKATPGENIAISFNNKQYETTANAQGDWRVKLAPAPAGGPYQIEIQGQNSISFNDVLVGEVWLCSGQSNMEWKVKYINHGDIEVLSANFPDIRIASMPRVGVNEPQFDINTQWQSTTPQTVGDFSSICYFYGRRLHQTLGVPIGLIKNSWGGTPIEAWIPRKELEQSKDYPELLAHWDKLAAKFDPEVYQQQLTEYKSNTKAWIAAGKPKNQKPRGPRNVVGGGHRPASIFNGVVNPTVGYGIRGVIWYQGETNSKRGYQYRSLFPLLIKTWRERWGQGEFPFYWAQLADFKKEVTTPSKYSQWAELREAQTMTLSIPNTGQAVLIDLGEGRNIHPGKKQDVAHRLVRHPLAKIYGYPLTADSPMYRSMATKNSQIIITLDNVTRQLYSYDTHSVQGFYIAGKDQRFVAANAKIIGKNKIAVYSDDVQNPVAVRYGWEDNPVVNLYDKGGLPVTPFRTDDWPLGSTNIKK